MIIGISIFKSQRGFGGIGTPLGIGDLANLSGLCRASHCGNWKSGQSLHLAGYPERVGSTYR